MRVFTLCPLPRAAQRLAIYRNHVTVGQERLDIREDLPEGGIERLGIDHAKHCREGIMRRDRVPELQEVPEDVRFCTSEGGHLQAACGAAQHENERGHEQFAKLVVGVLGARIRDAVEGCEEGVHGGGGLPKLNSTSKSTPRPQETPRHRP